MGEPRFDPARFYEFDLGEGAVRSRDGARVLVLPDSALTALVSAAVKGGELSALTKLGRTLGAQALASLGGSADTAAPETVLGHAGAVIALFGFGKLSLERWGDALIATLAQQPKLDDDDFATAAFLSGVFSALSGRDVAAVALGEHARYAIVDPSIAGEVLGWAREGADLPTIVSRLVASEAS